MSAEYPLAVWCPTANYTRGRAKAVTAIVYHHTDGQPRLDRAVKHLQKSRADYAAEGRDKGGVSAHFLVGQGGEIVQLVHLADTAWHASGVNAHTVGIEHIARTPSELSPSDPGLKLTQPQLAASAALVAWLCARLQMPVDDAHIVPHHCIPGTSHSDCGLDVLRGGIWPTRDWFAAIRASATK